MDNGNLRVPTSEQAREYGRRGGLASAQAKRERKALKEEMLLLLEEGDTQKKLCLQILEEALKGNTKAFEIVRDTIGEKPTEKTEIIGELPPLVVRELKTNDAHNGNSDTVSAVNTEKVSQ